MNDVEHYFRVTDPCPPQLRQVQEVIKCALERHIGDDVEWSRREFSRDRFSEGQRFFLDEMVCGQGRLSKSVEDLESMLTERLTRIEGLLSDGSTSCRFERSDVGMARTDSFMSIELHKSGQKAKASPESFMNRLKKLAQDARVLVLVEPYALADSNESGEKGDCLGKIQELIVDLSIDKLHLYCRQDALSLDVVKKLDGMKGLRSKISIHVGDLHDRYLLSGADKKGDEVDWHTCPYWKGWVFGASLNGISKRPTYIVPFEPKDIISVSSYLNDHTISISLEGLKKELQSKFDDSNAARATCTQADGEDSL
ncbi:hypothetical protein PQ786_04200 [Alcaligenes faecalis]